MTETAERSLKIPEQYEVLSKDERELVIITNPHSHNGRTKLSEILEWTQGQGTNLTLRDSKRPDHIKELVSEILETVKNPLIVIVGGDGSVFNAVNGLFAARKRPEKYGFLFFPAGCGCDAANTFGYKQNPEAVKNSILEDSRIEKVDALKMSVAAPDGSEKIYYGMSHIGFAVSALAAKLINEKRPKTISGRALEAIKASRSPQVKINLGGRNEILGDIIIMNGPQMGKLIRSDANPRDGKFDLFLIEGKGLPLVGRGIKAAFIPERGIKRPRIEFEAGDVMPQIDGESIEKIEPGSRVKVEVEKASVPVVKI